MRSFALPLTLALIAASPAASQEEQRYQLERTEDGYVRMDTRTGEMTRCQENGSQLICRPAVEEPDESRDQSRNDAERGNQVELELGTPADTAAEELERLRDSVESLEQRVEALEAAKPVAVLPTEKDFEQTMDFAERFLRRFMGIAKELEDEKPDSSDGAAPNRT